MGNTSSDEEEPRVVEDQVISRRGDGDGSDCPEHLSAEDVASSLLHALQLRGQLTDLVTVSHAYSHFKLDLEVFMARADPTPVVAEQTQRQWVDGEDLAGFALHGAHKKILPALDIA